MLLPIVIHNICISLEGQAYKFVQPALRLYKAVDTKSLSLELASMVEKTIDCLSELQCKENELYAEQYAKMKEQEKYARENGDPFNIEAELAVFNHLEADMSSFYKKLLMLIMIGTIKQEGTIADMLCELRTLCIEILTIVIPKKQQALINVNKVLKK